MKSEICRKSKTLGKKCSGRPFTTTTTVVFFIDDFVWPLNIVVNVLFCDHNKHFITPWCRENITERKLWKPSSEERKQRDRRVIQNRKPLVFTLVFLLCVDCIAKHQRAERKLRRCSRAAAAAAMALRYFFYFTGK